MTNVSNASVIEALISTVHFLSAAITVRSTLT